MEIRGRGYTAGRGRGRGFYWSKAGSDHSPTQQNSRGKVASRGYRIRRGVVSDVYDVRDSVDKQNFLPADTSKRREDHHIKPSKDDYRWNVESNQHSSVSVDRASRDENDSSQHSSVSGDQASRGEKNSSQQSSVSGNTASRDEKNSSQHSSGDTVSRGEKNKPQRQRDPSSFQQFADQRDMDIAYHALQELEPVWHDPGHAFLSEKQRDDFSKEKLYWFFKQADNAWDVALTVLLTAADYQKAKNNSLAYFCMRTFAKFCKENTSWFDQNSSTKLTPELKLLAFNACTGRHYALFDAVVGAYKLDQSGKEQFIPEIEKLLGMDLIKEAAQIAGRLSLQDHFSQDKILIPLLLQGKINLVELYLKGNPRQQQEFVQLLDRLSARQTDICQFVQRANVKGSQGFQKKTVSKLAGRLMKLYNIPAEFCPNIMKSRAAGGLRFLMYKRFVEQSMGSGPWRELAENAVAYDSCLQLELVEELAASNQLEEAVYWMKHFHLHDKDVPETVLNYRTKDKTDGSGQPLVEEDWDAEGSTYSASEMESAFYGLSLSESQISFVQSLEQLENFYSRIQKPNSVIGYDSEWRPGFVGHQPRVALMQIAVQDHVFLLDIHTLSKLFMANDWVQLALAIFCNPNIVTLGYGLETDLRILVKSFPAVKEPLLGMQRVVDLAQLEKAIFAHDSLQLNSIDEHVASLEDESPKEPDESVTELNDKKNQGLSQLVYQLFGKFLSKKEQMSDWERRPLRPAQITYAALDAYVLLEVYDRLKSIAKHKQFRASLEPHLSLKWSTSSRNDRKKAKAAGRQERKKKMTTEQPKQARLRGCLPTPVQQFRVVVDNSLVGMGQQLRTCGADVKILDDHLPHIETVQISVKENRIVLTTGLPYHSIRASVGERMCHFVESQGAKEQTLEVLKVFNIQVQLEDIFSRCQVCNGGSYAELSGEALHQLMKRKLDLSRKPDVQPDEPEEVVSHWRKIFADSGIDYESVTLISSKLSVQVEIVPDAKWDTINLFYVCLTCGKVFWKGSHFDNVCEQFSDILAAGKINVKEDSQDINETKAQGIDETKAQAEVDSSVHQNIVEHHGFCQDDKDNIQLVYHVEDLPDGSSLVQKSNCGGVDESDSDDGWCF